MMGEMDHQEVRDLLADEAIEPAGLDRLMAGDTPTAALVAGHLAGCPDCADELERLRRSVGIIRPMVRAVPPPELRERTLAYIAAVGRPRGPAMAETEHNMSAEPRAIASRGRTMRASRVRMLAGLAAAILIAVTGTALVVNGNRDSLSGRQAAEIEELGKVGLWTVQLDAQPDVQHVQLASTTGGSTTGTLVYSPSSNKVVVVAANLAPAPTDHEYRCWVEVGGQRASIGKMFFGGELAYWVGSLPQIAGLGPSARFGVSLVDLGATDKPGEPVLVSAG
jgi:Anti-sigma-K factor rskA